MGNFDIYLPIAEMPVNIITILILGAIGGFLAGLFGIGGGFLVTPLLIFIGISPAVAVATSANQIIAASVSGFLAHWQRRNVDIKMGVYLLVGSFIGSLVGVWIFRILKEIGQIDLVISLCYVIFLTGVGGIMGVESFRAIFNKKKGIPSATEKKVPWIRRINLPFMVYFPRSDIKVSALIIISTSIFSGIMVSLMGIGGGFLMIPVMIYTIGMPVSLVVGTSLFQIIFTTCNVTFLQAINTHSVDIVLAFLLLIGSVVGAQFGTKMGLKLPAEKMRAALALLILVVAIKLSLGLLVTPDNPFSLIEVK